MLHICSWRYTQACILGRTHLNISYLTFVFSARFIFTSGFVDHMSQLLACVVVACRIVTCLSLQVPFIVLCVIWCKLLVGGLQQPWLQCPIIPNIPCSCVLGFLVKSPSYFASRCGEQQDAREGSVHQLVSKKLQVLQPVALSLFSLRVIIVQQKD